MEQKEKVRATMVRVSETKACRIERVADQLGLKAVDIYRVAVDVLLEEVEQTGQLPHKVIDLGGAE